VTVTGKVVPNISTQLVSVSSRTKEDCIIEADRFGVQERLKKRSWVYIRRGVYIHLTRRLCRATGDTDCIASNLDARRHATQFHCSCKQASKGNFFLPIGRLFTLGSFFRKVQK
jgi:hypothetical protein